MNVESAAVLVLDGTLVNVTVNKKSLIVKVLAVVVSVKITAVSAVEMVSKKDSVIVTKTLMIVTMSAVVLLL